MGGAAPRPSTRTMVLCTWTRGSRVRCAPRQRRPGRAARAAGRRSRSLPDSLPDFRKGKLPDFSSQKNIKQYSLSTYEFHCRGRREKKREEGAKGPIGLTDVWGGLAAQAAKPCKIVEHFALLSDRVPALACE